jgi:cell division protein ZipA
VNPVGDLRLILLGTGLVFLLLLAWFGSRRPRRARDEPDAPRGFADGGPRSEPGFADRPLARAAAAAMPAGSEPRQDAGAHHEEDERTEASLRRDPPVIEWSDAVAAPQGEPRLSSLESMPVMQGGPSFSQPAVGHGDDPDANVSTVRVLPEPAGAAQAPLVIAWPPEPERFIASLRVVAGRGERIGGRQLRQSLAACGFRHGPFGIYHLPLADGRVLVSAASLVRPGLLDPESMDFQQFPGLNLFAVLPAPVDPAIVFERLCSSALDLAARVAGDVQDESGAPLLPEATQDWRARCIASFAQREPPPAAGNH